MKAGADTSPFASRAGSALAPTTEDLSSIQSGISHTAEDQVQAGRMKIELVTNVPHDIRTSLTSIIDYIGPLRQEHDLSEHV